MSPCVFLSPVDEHGVSLRPSYHRWHIWSNTFLCFGVPSVRSQSLSGAHTHTRARAQWYSQINVITKPDVTELQLNIFIPSNDSAVL